MQFSKVLLALCATLVCMTPLAGRAADKASKSSVIAPTPSAPDAVERAREALRQKMDELVGQAPATTPPAPVRVAPAPPKPAAIPEPPAPEPKPAPAPEPAPAPPQAQAVPEPPQSPTIEVPPSRPVIPVADREAITKAREALRERMAELNGQPAQSEISAKPAVAVQATEKQPAEVKPKPIAVKTPAEKPMAPEMALAKERQGEQKRLKEEAEAKKRADEAALKAAKKRKPPESAPKLTPVVSPQHFEPLPGPPLPISTEKQQRLSELLIKYKADQITPEQYHAERAKILAEP